MDGNPPLQPGSASNQRGNVVGSLTNDQYDDILFGPSDSDNGEPTGGAATADEHVEEDSATQDNAAVRKRAAQLDQDTSFSGPSKKRRRSQTSTVPADGSTKRGPHRDGFKSVLFDGTDSSSEDELLEKTDSAAGRRAKKRRVPQHEQLDVDTELQREDGTSKVHPKEPLTAENPDLFTGDKGPDTKEFDYEPELRPRTTKPPIPPIPPLVKGKLARPTEADVLHELDPVDRTWDEFRVAAPGYLRMLDPWASSNSRCAYVWKIFRRIRGFPLRGYPDNRYTGTLDPWDYGEIKIAYTGSPKVARKCWSLGMEVHGVLVSSLLFRDWLYSINDHAPWNGWDSITLTPIGLLKELDRRLIEAALERTVQHTSGEGYRMQLGMLREISDDDVYIEPPWSHQSPEVNKSRQFLEAYEFQRFFTERLAESAQIVKQRAREEMAEDDYDESMKRARSMESVARNWESRAWTVYTWMMRPDSRAVGTTKGAGMPKEISVRSGYVHIHPPSSDGTSKSKVDLELQ
ncbi:hypothetical protein BDV95DRAFT_47441 [Massariosphaeria phaeospora]|uniref:Uncharacterized protein n=1 Tax=Massariosphaeria phaeospora TaxID=100035 RepID=A0A7C8M8Q7_9PLEO|nr:hypothetical protein BDV95DRAFT_47441 [Massariosphaeria phaeospora]